MMLLELQWIRSNKLTPWCLNLWWTLLQVQVPRGRLFAFDSEGQHVLTCSSTGGLVSRVNIPSFWHYYYFRAFIRRFCPKELTVIHTYMHTLMAAAATQWHLSTQGTVWVSVSSPRTLWYVDEGNQTSDLLITRYWLYPWATFTLTCIYLYLKF